MSLLAFDFLHPLMPPGYGALGNTGYRNQVCKAKNVVHACFGPAKMDIPIPEGI